MERHRVNDYPTGCFLTSVACDLGPTPGVNAIRSGLINLNQGRFIGGGQAGYNWQSGKIVGGIEGDISWTGINQTTITFKTMTRAARRRHGSWRCQKEDWISTVRGRVGFLVAPTCCSTRPAVWRLTRSDSERGCFHHVGKHLRRWLCYDRSGYAVGGGVECDDARSGHQG